MGGVLARDKMKRLGVVEPTTNSAFQQHKNRKLASMAMHATSKAPWDSAANFKAAIAEQLTGRPCVLVATGEFDPNLVAKEGGSRACLDFMQGEVGLTAAELNIMEATGHGACVMRPGLSVRVFLEWGRRQGLVAPCSSL